MTHLTASHLLPTLPEALSALKARTEGLSPAQGPQRAVPPGGGPPGGL